LFREKGLVVGHPTGEIPTDLGRSKKGNLNHQGPGGIPRKMQFYGHEERKGRIGNGKQNSVRSIGKCLKKRANREVNLWEA